MCSRPSMPNRCLAAARQARRRACGKGSTKYGVGGTAVGSSLRLRPGGPRWPRAATPRHRSSSPTARTSLVLQRPQSSRAATTSDRSWLRAACPRCLRCPSWRASLLREPPRTISGSPRTPASAVFGASMISAAATARVLLLRDRPRLAQALPRRIGNRLDLGRAPARRP